MKTTTRKTASKLPFNVPAPVEKALKTAGSRFDAFSVKARSVAARTEEQVKVAAKDLQTKGQSLANTVGSAVEKGLHTLNVPTRQELRSLSAKVDGLGKKIDALKTRRAPRAARSAR